MKESYIQTKVNEFARSLGWEVCRLKNKDDPDRLYYRQSIVIFIEFKKPGGKVSPGQKETHRLLRHHKMNFFLVDTISQGKKIFKERENNEPQNCISGRI